MSNECAVGFDPATNCITAVMGGQGPVGVYHAIGAVCVVFFAVVDRLVLRSNAK